MNLLDKQGQRFSAMIHDKYCEEKIQIENYRVYLCQNIAEGKICRDKLGYEYSYVIDEFVKDLKIREQEKINPLPKYWAVKHDGSELCKNTLLDVFKTYYLVNIWTASIKGNYYGYDGRNTNNGTYHSSNISSFRNPVKILTLEELINLTTNNTNNLTINENNYEKNSIKVQRKTSVITSGKRYTGNPISGGRSKVAISLGHLGYSAIYQ